MKKVLTLIVLLGMISCGDALSNDSKPDINKFKINQNGTEGSGNSGGSSGGGGAGGNPPPG